MDQDRRDAAAWAKEWQIRQKNRRLLMALGFIALLALIGYMIYFTIVHVERTTFKSVEDMRKAMQGRYAIERDYEDIIIEGDEITLTYMSFSHYDREFAEKYGYDYSGEDSVYDDHIEEWDYRNGVIRTQWMGDIIVDKNGNIRRGDRYYSTFFRTDKPRPEPIDPSTLSTPEGDINADISVEDEQLFEEREEIIESTEDAAEDAVTEGENDVQT
ncbi:MAG: hypothetical protein IJJ03_00080 [Mogibacterium sp.]|nr:hypothetical protein [Mogibacterium sp.]